MAKTAKKGNSTKKSNRKPKQGRAESDGDHLRQLAPERAVRSFISEIIATKNATSEAGQGLSTATKRASEAGVNIPAARIAARLLSKAKQDGLKARVLWEDVIYYLIECTDFVRLAPEGMFTAEEGGQKRSRKAQPKQQELPVGEPQPQPPVDTLAGSDDTGFAVH
jgi:hypothetical protein